jgi:hypothetical protein
VTLFLRLVVRVRVSLFWYDVGVVGVAFGRIKIPNLYPHTRGELHGGISEVIAMCVVRSLISATWSSRRSSDLARSVSRCVAGLRWRPG